METEGTRTLLGNQRAGVLALAVPIAAALFFQQLNGVADSLWVSGLGGDALAAVGIVYPIYTILIGIGNGLGIGVAAMIARSIGAGRKEDADAGASQGLVIAAVAGIIATPLLLLTMNPVLSVMGGDTEECAEYAFPIYACCFFVILSGVMSGMLRGEGAARRSMAIQIAGAVTNMILDPLLIYGAGMGVSGAAWATGVSFAVSCSIACFWYARSSELFVRISAKKCRLQSRICHGILSVGGPEALELSIMYVFNIFLNFVVISVGGTGAVGLYSTGWRIANFILIAAQAMGGALVAICSAEYGMGRFDMIEDAFLFTVRRSVLYTIVLSLILAVLSGPISMVFTVSDDLLPLREGMRDMLLFFAVLLPVMSLVYTGSALLQALGRARGAMLNSLARNILLCTGFAVVAINVGTLTSLWCAMTAIEILGGVMMGVHARVALRGVRCGYK